MPSVNKTMNLGLNQWASNEYPKRLDFVEDNAAIDAAIGKLAAYAEASGTNTYIATIAGIAALTEGFSIKIKFTNANTGASTLNINGLGAKDIKKGNGNDLGSGNIKAGQICNLVYNGVNFQLLGEGGEYGTAQAQHVLDNYTIGTESGLIEGTMPNNGPTVAETVNLTNQNQEYTIAQGYHSGLRKIKAVITNLAAGVIKAGVTVGGILGTYTSDATATAAQMLAGAKAYVNGVLVTGSMVDRSASNQIATAVTNSVGRIYLKPPVGYYDGANWVQYDDANFIAANIKNGVNLLGIVGNYTGVELTADTLNILQQLRIVNSAGWDGNIYSTAFKESFKFNILFKGTANLYFEFASRNGTPMYARIYVDDVQVGSDFTAPQNSLVTVSQNITVNQGSKVAIWFKSSSPYVTLSNVMLRGKIGGYNAMCYNLPAQ